MKNKIAFLIMISTTVIACSFVTSLFPKPEFKQSEYLLKTDFAKPGADTSIELMDGAAIVIPASSTEPSKDDMYLVKIERNPEKTSSFEPFDENMTPLGDFYNFEIDNGQLVGPVELVLPFDESLIPNKPGIMVAALPGENGWEYIPVIPDGNKVKIYTTDLGDPLIMWHFTDARERIDLGHQAGQREPLTVCDARIPVQVIPAEGTLDDQYTIIGQVIPVDKSYGRFGITTWFVPDDLKAAEYIPVEIKINLSGSNPGKYLSVITDQQGNFTFGPVRAEDLGLNEGWNWVFVGAQCDKWWGKINVKSKGYAEFKLKPIEQAQLSTEPTEDTVETPPATIIETPPAIKGGVLLPDFVGMYFDDAVQWLVANGFSYTWRDGLSTYEPGQVYKQLPEPGSYYVPSGTTVLLYRTTEKTTTQAQPTKTNISSPIEYLIDSLVTIRYETTTAYRYDWDGDKINFTGFAEYSNNKGDFHTVYSYSDGKKTQENDFRLTTSNDHPLTSSLYGNPYWWIPGTDSPYHIDERNDVSGTWTWKVSAHDWAPGNIENISLADQSFQARKYTTQYDIWDEDSKQYAAYKQKYSVQISSYYDIQTGLLLRSEYSKKFISCKIFSSDPISGTKYLPHCDTLVGKTEIVNYDATVIMFKEDK